MNDEISVPETAPYSEGSLVFNHGPDKCHCTTAEKCPYWTEKLDQANLSMNRGKSLGPQTSNLIYVGGTRELDKIQQKQTGPKSSKPTGHGPQ